MKIFLGDFDAKVEKERYFQTSNREREFTWCKFMIMGLE